MTARMKALFLVLALAGIALSYQTWLYGHTQGRDDGYQEAWTHIPIEQRPPAPLNPGDTP